MGTEREMFYWVNVNLPNMQYRSDGLSMWRRKVGETKWKYHEGLLPTWPSEWRFSVSLPELDENRELS